MEVVDGRSTQIFDFENQDGEGTGTFESGKFSVTMVAEMVGMRNLKNFRGRYKEYFGKTPKEFMKKYDIYLKKTFIERLSHIR